MLPTFKVHLWHYAAVYMHNIIFTSNVFQSSSQATAILLTINPLKPTVAIWVQL